MTDHPRYETVKGPPDTAHRHSGYAGLGDLVLRPVDRRRGSAGAATVRAAARPDHGGFLRGLGAAA
jgi:hypothetical protein